MKRRTRAALILTVIATMLVSGCGMQATYKVKSSGAVSVTETLYLTEEEKTTLMSSDSSTAEESTEDMKDLGTEVIDGVTYHKYQSTEKMSKTEQKKNLIVHDGNKFESIFNRTTGSTSSDENIMQMVKTYGGFYSVTYKFDKKVVKSNGKIQKDGKTVVYDSATLSKVKENRYYAIFSNSAYKSTKVTVKGIKNKGTYKGSCKISVDAKSVISRITLNGKQANITNYSTTMNGKTSVIKDTFTASKKGKNTLKVYLVNGKSKTYTFTIK